MNEQSDVLALPSSMLGYTKKYRSLIKRTYFKYQFFISHHIQHIIQIYIDIILSSEAVVCTVVIVA